MKAIFGILFTPIREIWNHHFLKVILFAIIILAAIVGWLILGIFELSIYKTDSFLKFPLNFKSHTNLKLQMAAILGTCISLSVPFALNTVSRYTDKFKDGEMSKIVLKDPYYLLMLFYVLPLISILVAASFLFEKNKIVDFVMYLFFVYGLVILLGFLRRLSEYTINFNLIVKEENKLIADECIKP